MDIPILEIYDQLHQELDKIEETWPLYHSQHLSWIHDFNQMIYEEWAGIESRLCRLQERMAEQRLEEPYQKVRGYMTLGMYEEARQSLNLILDQTPNALPAHLLLALVDYETKEYKQAQQQLERIIACSQYEPLRNYATLLLGCASGKQGNWTEALHWFKQVFQSDPASEEALFNQALCYYQLGDKDKTVDLIKNLLVLKPDDAQLIRLLQQLDS